MDTFFTRPKLMAGDRALSNLPHELKMKNLSKPMVISECMEAYKPFYKYLKGAFDNDKIKMNAVVMTDDKVASIDTINKFIETYKESESDSIIVVGREAVLSMAKLVKLAIEQGVKDIKSLESIKNTDTYVPLIVVPVFYGSGSEAKGYARSYSSNVSYDYESDRLMPDIVVADSSMVMRPSKQIMASSIMFALGTAITAYTDKNAGIMTRTTAMSAIEILCNSINDSRLKKRSQEFACNVMTSTVIAGMAANSLEEDSLALISTIVSQCIKVPYSKVYSMLFIHYYRRVLDRDDNFYMDVLLPIIGEKRYVLTPINKRAEEVVDNVEKLIDFLREYSGFRTTLSEFKVAHDALHDIADKVAKAGIDRELIEGVLEDAFEVKKEISGLNL